MPGKICTQSLYATVMDRAKFKMAYRSIHKTRQINSIVKVIPSSME